MFKRSRYDTARFSPRGAVKPARLRFTGRTASPNSSFGPQNHSAVPLQIWARRAALFCLVCVFVVALLHARLGDLFGFPPLRFAATNFPFAAARLAPQNAGFWATLLAFPLFLALLTQELGARGGATFFLFFFAFLGLWRLAAQVLGAKNPPFLPLLILGPQLFGALYYFSTFAPATTRLETPNRAFDFHCHTNRSNGLLSPQQQIDWHRKRGFSGLAFTDSNRLMPDAMLGQLRAQNPDFILLNGQEYHGDAHLIILGAREPISAQKFDVSGAIQEAKRQGAIVIFAHPWWPAKFSTDEVLKMGADGLEAWNGAIWDKNLAQKARNLVATTATDTLSKSGAKCFTWTLLPAPVKTPADVLAALKAHQTRPVFALNDKQTPSAFDERQTKMKKLGGVFLAFKSAWLSSPHAMKLSVFWSGLALFFAGFAWATAPAQRGREEHAGPKSAVGFLKKKRVPRQIFGAFLMITALAGCLAATIMGFGEMWKPETAAVWFGPGMTLLSWIFCDWIFFQGRNLFRRNWRAR